MSDRGDDTPAAPATHGAPTGPLPGPRPPVSGWPQPPQHGGSSVPPTPSQTTGPGPAGPGSGRPTQALPRPTGAFGHQNGGGYGPPASAFGSGPPALASPPPFGTGYLSSGSQGPGAPGSGSPGSGVPGHGAPTSAIPYSSGPPGGGFPPAGAARGPRPFSLIGLVLSLILLLVVVVQAVLLAGLSGDLDDATAAQSNAESAAAKDREDLTNLTKRVQSIEERTEGTLNSTAVAKKVLPSVFSVRAGQATGTAFAFGTDPAGGTLLITNYHVVDSLVSAGGKNATITRDSESYPVTIDRTDKNRDLAVLRTTAKFTPLKPSESEVEPGDPVIVVGAPLGLTDTVTTGVVSAIRDDVEGLATRVIQFDAAINPGNSGGPVINAEGEVVGIAQAKIIAEGADGLGLAIPISEACKGLISC